MPFVEFASSIQRHAPVPPSHFEGNSVTAVLEQVFDAHPEVRGYVLDDRGQVRKHIAIFVNDSAIADRAKLSDRVTSDDKIYVIQALSGG